MGTDQALVTAEDRSLAIPDLKREWIDFERSRGQSPATLDAYGRSLDVFQEWVDRQGGIDGTARDIRSFKNALQDDGYSIQTVNLRLSAVRSFYRFLVEMYRLSHSPAESVRGIKRSKSRKHKRDALTGAEIHRVLQTCGGTGSDLRDHAILILMAFCGLRTVEIYRADIDDLQTKQDRLVLYVQGKGAREKDDYVVIPVHKEHVIREWIRYRKKHFDGDPLFVSFSNRNRGSRLSKRSIRRMIAMRYDQAGVVGSRKTAHSLRHSAITSAIKNGASPLQVQAMARHASFDTTLGYIHEVGRIDDPAEDLIRFDVD